VGRKAEQFRVELEFDKFIQHGTFQMFHAVARSNQLTLQQKGVYSMLASYAFSLDEESWPSHQRLAEESGVSSRYIGKIINELVKFGLIRKRERQGGTNVYTLVFPDRKLLAKLFPNGYKTSKEGGTIVPEGWNNSSGEGGTIVPGGWNNSSTKEKEENKEEKKKKNSRDVERENQIQELWEYWKKTFDGYFAKASLTDKRRKHLNARLNDGFTVDELKRYMDYVRQTDFYLEKGVFFIENIMREASRVERGLTQFELKQKAAVNKQKQVTDQSNASVGGGIYRNVDEMLDKLFD
jgi:hypothetical protein